MWFIKLKTMKYFSNQNSGGFFSSVIFPIYRQSYILSKALPFAAYTRSKSKLEKYQLKQSSLRNYLRVIRLPRQPLQSRWQLKTCFVLSPCKSACLLACLLVEECLLLISYFTGFMFCFETAENRFILHGWIVLRLVFKCYFSINA